jgi:hypothetical protein
MEIRQELDPPELARVLMCLQALDQERAQGVVTAGWIAAGEYEYGSVMFGTAHRFLTNQAHVGRESAAHPAA